MVHPDDQQLVNDCYKIRQTLDHALQWVGNYLAPEKQNGVRDTLRRYRRTAERYEKAATLRPAAAIFGLSQVGKSYLVANLVRKPGETELEILSSGISSDALPQLLRREKADKVDFIRDINPPGGGKEATGCVTRFTVKESLPPGINQGYLVRLFSQCDIVKIMANGYLADLKDYDYKIDRELISTILKDITERKSPQIMAGFTEDEVYDLRDYLESTFKDHIIIRDLGNLRFWDDIADIIPYIDASERGKIFELIWGRQSFFSNLFSQLTQGLIKLNFASEIVVKLPALAPRVETIIDIERIRELFDQYTNRRPDWSALDPVELSTRDGRNLSLHRSIVAALAREVVLPIPADTANDSLRQFLGDADIFDFPGARSRKKIEEATFSADQKIENQVEVFIRGKVSYLFDLYQQSFEISSLVFCMDNAQPNVVDIQKLIHNWIVTSHGATPDDRENRENKLRALVPNSTIERLIPLLFVMTKFNLDLNPNNATDVVGNSQTHDGKWISRLQANFDQFMTESLLDKWTQDWNRGDKSFKNSFLLRDPGYPGGVYEGYEQATERFVAGQEPRVQDIRTSFLSSKYVSRSFRDPQLAWEEAVTPGNDGGVHRVIRYLGPVCHPAIKRHQISEAIRSLLNDVGRELCAHYEGGDAAQKLKRANEKGAMIWVKMTMMRAHFGQFLDALSLPEDVAWKIYYEMMNVGVKSVQQTKASETELQQRTAIMETALRSLLSEHSLANLNKEQVYELLRKRLGIENAQVDIILQQAKINLDDIFQAKEQPRPADHYAEQVLGEWIKRTTRLKNDSNIQIWGLTEEDTEVIRDEMIRNSDRIGLKKVIANALHPHIQNFNTSQNYDIVARITTLKVNEFVNTLGWSFVSEQEKKEGEIYVATSDAIPLFSFRPAPVLEKSEIKTDHDMGLQLHTAWTAAIQRSFAYNVKNEHKIKNMDQVFAMQALGEIIKQLEYNCP